MSRAAGVMSITSACVAGAVNHAEIEKHHCFFAEYPQNEIIFVCIQVFGEFENIHSEGSLLWLER
jgi:hypothetical protein